MLLRLTKKPHRNRCCEVTIVTVSDAVRPRRGLILASAQPDSGRGPRPDLFLTKAGRGRDLRSRKYKYYCASTRSNPLKKPLCCNPALKSGLAVSRSNTGSRKHASILSHPLPPLTPVASRGQASKILHHQFGFSIGSNSHAVSSLVLLCFNHLTITYGGFAVEVRPGGCVAVTQ